MSSQPKHTWEESKIVDDVSFQAKDAETFKNLLNNKVAVKGPETTNVFIPGSILKGRIVEITKDHVVIDVGLKSEGMVPISEFSDPSDIELGREVEVLLDQPEDDH